MSELDFTPGRWAVRKGMYSWQDPLQIARQTLATVYYAQAKYPRQDRKDEIIATFATKDAAMAFKDAAIKLENIRDSRIGEAGAKFRGSLKALIEESKNQ